MDSDGNPARLSLSESSDCDSPGSIAEVSLG